MQATPDGNIPTPEEVEEGGGNWWDIFFEVNPWWDDSGPIDVRDPLADVANTVGDLANAFNFITDPENWKRVALFVAGGIALIIGTIALMDNMGAGKAVGKVVSAVPAGRGIATIAKKVR